MMIASDWIGGVANVQCKLCTFICFRHSLMLKTTIGGMEKKLTETETIIKCQKITTPNNHLFPIFCHHYCFARPARPDPHAFGMNLHAKCCLPPFCLNPSPKSVFFPFPFHHFVCASKSSFIRSHIFLFASRHLFRAMLGPLVCWY